MKIGTNAWTYNFVISSKSSLVELLIAPQVMKKLNK
jgi:hypothetical protein